MAQILNDANFSQEIKSFPGVALVDFWAPWCGPCKLQGPIVEELASTMADNNQVKIGKINVDENQISSEEFQILSIPTIKIFKNGQVVDEMIGLQSKADLVAVINKHLA